jgi:hypothetical protein
MFIYIYTYTNTCIFSNIKKIYIRLYTYTHTNTNIHACIHIKYYTLYLVVCFLNYYYIIIQYYNIIL